MTQEGICMVELIRTIEGYSCDVYTVTGDRRIKIGEAVPEVEIYEQSVKVKTLGTMGINYKRTYLSVVICPDPEMNEGVTFDNVRQLKAFDLVVKLQRKDGAVVPINMLNVVDADISEDEWRFTITDHETVKKLRMI